jgi:hypothetical protein
MPLRAGDQVAGQPGRGEQPGIADDAEGIDGGVGELDDVLVAVAGRCTARGASGWRRFTAAVKTGESGLA